MGLMGGNIFIDVRKMQKKYFAGTSQNLTVKIFNWYMIA